jgi:peptidyl-prolyl cis-trans isomerase B (cyclophilin B)
LSSDPNRPRPRSSKKRRAVQSGPSRSAGGGQSRQSSQGGAGGGVRGGSASSGLSTAWLAAIVVVVFAIGVALAGGVIKFGGGSSPASSVAVRPSAAAGGTRGTNCPTAAPSPAATGEVRLVTIETAKGTIAITVDPALGPRAAANFIALASCGFYDGIGFHRLVPDFVIQGGDPDGTGGGGPGYEFADDPVAVPYVRGIVAMANSGKDTNGSQFFIVLADNSDLTPSYSVFGRVTAGMDVVDAIAAMPNSGAPSNKALDPVIMTSVTVGAAGAASPSVSTRPATGPSSSAPSSAPVPSPSAAPS